MSAQVNRLTNANVFIDGRNMLGRAEEVNLPGIKQIMSEHKALGMNAKFELPSGVDKMEAKFKWNSVYEDLYKIVGDPTSTLKIQVRSSLKKVDGSGVLSEEPVVAFMGGQFKDFPALGFKQHDNVDAESMFNVTYYKLVVNGVDIVEIDVMANIYKVAGTDILAKYRANLGI